jgi:hypothetical protein
MLNVPPAIQKDSAYAKSGGCCRIDGFEDSDGLLLDLRFWLFNASSIQSISEHLDDFPASAFQYLVIDEAHHAAARRRVRPPERGDDLHERHERLPRLLQPQLRQPPPQQDLAVAEAGCEKLLAARFVNEDAPISFFTYPA